MVEVRQSGGGDGERGGCWLLTTAAIAVGRAAATESVAKAGALKVVSKASVSAGKLAALWRHVWPSWCHGCCFVREERGERASESKYWDWRKSRILLSSLLLFSFFSFSFSFFPLSLLLNFLLQRPQQWKKSHLNSACILVLRFFWGFKNPFRMHVYHVKSLDLNEKYWFLRWIHFKSQI